MIKGGALRESGKYNLVKETKKNRVKNKESFIIKSIGRS